MTSIHDEYVKKGIRFTKADKRPGSRERGFLLLRQRLKATVTRNWDQPWILFHRNCMHTISQLPELPISPENPQDVDSASNDHLYDMVKYRTLKSVLTAETADVGGL